MMADASFDRFKASTAFQPMVGVPRRLCREHSLQRLVRHAGMRGAALAQGRLEEREMFRTVHVHVRRHMRGFIGCQVREALLADRSDHLARCVDGIHRNPRIAAEQKDVAVVVPGVAPVLVPLRLLDEGRVGQFAAVPPIERRLLRVGIHLQPDQHPSSALVQRAQHLQLHAMEFD